jgi:glucokinase
MSDTSVAAPLAGSGAVLGIDVGGTGIKARLVGPDDALLAERRLPTPQGDHDGARLADVVTGLAVEAQDLAAAAGTALTAVGLVVPGVVDDATGVVARAVNLGWEDLPLRAVVSARLAAAGAAVPLAFGQDVRAGALAEAASADPSGTGGTIAFLAVGTGLAAALVVDGVLLHGRGWAGEVGQVRITSGPHAGLRVEEIAAAGAVARRAGAPDARTVAERVTAGDPEARAVWDDCVAVLADVMAWLTAVAGCDTIVVGGGLAEAGALLTVPLEAALRHRLPNLRVPVVTRARHGDAAGMIGATALARLAADVPSPAPAPFPTA